MRPIIGRALSPGWIKEALVMKNIEKLSALTCLLVVGLFTVYLPAAFASEAPLTCSPVQLSSGTIAAGIGYSWGHGTLNYNGKQYPFKIDGLDVGSVGVHEANSRGEVCNLTRLEDFNGNYAGVAAGATVGGGGSAMTLRNQNGVVLDLTSTTQGVSFTLAPSGVNINLQR